MSKFIKTVSAAALACSAALFAEAEPPAWIVSDEDSQIILFPTVHALPEGLEWRTEALDRVIAESGEVWLEAGSPDDPAVAQEVQALVAAHGLSPDTPLSARLSESQYAELEAAAAKLGAPVASLEPLKPWLAALALTQADLAAAGISGERGVEAVLSDVFGDRPVRKLETAADQIRVLSSFDAKTEIDFLMSAVETAGTAGERLLEITKDWAAGDLDGMEAELIDELRAEFPAVYAAMFTVRNQNWTEILDAELKGEGVDFVAVGAGHLIGDDSVPNMLEAKGYKVERVSLSDIETF